jgi:signal transduction histidine kinase
MYPIIGNNLIILSIIPVLAFLLAFNLYYGLVLQFILIIHRFVAIKILGEDIQVLFSFGSIIGTSLNIILLFLINFFKTLIQRVKKAEDNLKTQNKELQIAKAKAEESDRLKTAFLANMSHEIRTPMNAIIGFSELLRNQNLSQEVRNTYFELIDTSGKHLMKLIDGIIDISKIEANKLSIIEKECKLNNLLSELFILFQSSTEMKDKPQVKLCFKNDLSSGQNIILTDEFRLRQILMNLIENAIKFTESGSIEVEYLIRNNNEIFFSVKDTGVGISEKALPVIFNHFRQGEETLSRKYSGTGLGLAISKACVNLLGGKIGLTSELGKGTTLHFTIPYKPVVK